MNYLIHWWRTDIGKHELAKIEKSIYKGCISQGQVTEDLERRLADLLNIPFVVLTASGSMALLMALIASGVRHGDEVIIPDQTFIATANAPFLLGAAVRLVDVKRERPLIDVEKIEKVITSKTKAILPVHLNGMAADMSYIKGLASKYNINIIEDAAQAFCSRNHYGYLGTQSDMGIFSLGMTKLITTGQGGFVATDKEETYIRLRRIRNHGSLSISPSHFDTFGFNFKFNDILAGVGLAQVEKVKEKVEKQKRIYSYYKEGIKDLKFIKLLDVDIDNGELPLWADALCAEREKVLTLLKEKGIEAIPFPPGLHRSPYLDNTGEYKYSDIYAEHGLILPSGPDRGIRDIECTVKILHELNDKIDRYIEDEVEKRIKSVS